jgi:hypothetical protein
MTLGSSLTPERVADIDLWESDEQVLAWLVTSLRFDYLSFKQLRRVVDAVYARLIDTHLSFMIKDKLALVKTEIRNRIENFVQDEVDKQTHAAFNRLFDKNRIHFLSPMQSLPIHDSRVNRHSVPWAVDSTDA